MYRAARGGHDDAPIGMKTARVGAGEADGDGEAVLMMLLRTFSRAGEHAKHCAVTALACLPIMPANDADGAMLLW